MGLFVESKSCFISLVFLIATSQVVKCSTHCDITVTGGSQVLFIMWQHILRKEHEKN